MNCNNCEQCKKYSDCFGFAEIFGRCDPEWVPGYDVNKLEAIGHDGLIENIRVPFAVLDI